MKIVLNVAVFLCAIILHACAADLHRACVKYTERIEVQDVCSDLSEEIDCTHEHGGVEHQCTAHYSETRRVCHSENVKVRECVRYVCKVGYQKNTKNQCVKFRS